jgi:hypothetical protein
MHCWLPKYPKYFGRNISANTRNISAIPEVGWLYQSCTTAARGCRNTRRCRRRGSQLGLNKHSTHTVTQERVAERLRGWPERVVVVCMVVVVVVVDYGISRQEQSKVFCEVLYKVRIRQRERGETEREERHTERERERDCGSATGRAGWYAHASHARGDTKRQFTVWRGFMSLCA